MRDDFAVFILSHGRAGSLTTVNSLKKAGYTGKWFVIIDDLDDQRDAYAEKFGENVITFDKKLWAEKTDTITNTGDLRSPVFARNACYEIARELGIKFFAEMDDDIMLFNFRYEDCGKLKGKPVKKADELFEAMLKWQEDCGITSLGIACGAGMIGGVGGKFKQGILRSLHQAFILRTDDPIKFVGLLNEDGIATEWCDRIGKMAFEITSVAQNCPKRSSNEGGLNDLYKANNEYVRAFYSIVACPAQVKIHDLGGGITLQRKSDTGFVKVISERWKKHA